MTHAEIERLCGLNPETVLGMVREVDDNGNGTLHSPLTHHSNMVHSSHKNSLFPAPFSLLPCCLSADGRITFEEWLQAMSGRSTLNKQHEERMVEKRRSMPDNPRSPSHATDPSESKPIEEQKEELPVPTDTITTPLIIAVN